MQTIYCTTANITSTPQKVVNLADYRPQQANWERQGECGQVVQGPWVSAAEQFRTRRHRSIAAGLDLWCSLGVIVMTLTFTLRVLAI